MARTNQLLHQGDQLIRAQGTVETQGVRAHPLQGESHGGDGTSGEGPPAALEGHGAQQGEVGAFLGRQYRHPGFVQVGHGLDDDEIRPRLDPGPDLLGELFIGLLQGEGACGFQALPQRSQIQGHQGVGLLGRHCLLG